MSGPFSSRNFVAAIRNLQSLARDPQSDIAHTIELLRYIAESLVWSEQHNEDFFTHFVIEDSLNLLSIFLEKCPQKQVVLQIIQTANILSHNLNQPEHKVYLLSSEFYSNVVSYPFDFTDDEIVEHYTSLLKGLATNTSSDKLLGFVIDNNFSLYARALMFINYKDNLIKTAARTVILTLLKLNHEKVNEYIIESGFIFLIIDVLMKQVYCIDKMIKANNRDGKFDLSINDCIDTLYYLNDMFEEVDPMFTDKLSNTFVLMFGPVLIGSINSEVHSQYHVAIHVAYFILVQVFSIFKNYYVVDAFAVCLMAREIPVLLLDICNEPPPMSPPEHVEFHSSTKVQNPIRLAMFSFLKCRDDNLVCLSLLALQGIITNTGISNGVLKSLRLLAYSKKDKDDEFLDYDEETMDTLLGIYTTYPLFRFTNYHIISKIIYEITTGMTAQSLPEYEMKVRKACCNNILKLQKLLESKEFSDPILNFFDEEWEFVKKITLAAVVAIKNHNIFPVIYEDEKISLDQKQPSSDIDLCRALVKLFFLMRKLIFHLNSEDPNIYPFVYSSHMKDWQCGNTYNTQSLMFTRVYIEDDEQPIKYMAEDDDFFVLIEPDLYRIDYGVVKAIQKWRYFSAAIGKKEHLLLLKGKNKSKYLLRFDESDNFYQEVEKITFKISSSRSLEMSMVESFLMDSCVSFLNRYI